MNEQYMTKEEAVSLVFQTTEEFNEMIMEPINKNIRQYDNERNRNALRLYEQFNSFSAVAKNLEDISDDIYQLENFEISQLLSLCRDISELYKLPVFKRMPDFIPDKSPIRYVSPGMSGNISSNLRNRNPRELSFVREVLGPIGERAYKNSKIHELTFIGQGLSLPTFSGGAIWLRSSDFEDPMKNAPGRYLLLHEVFHQVQYIRGVPLIELVKEIVYNYLPLTGEDIVYDYEPDLNKEKLSDIKFYEAQAALVGHFAQFYYELRDGKIIRNKYRNITRDACRLLKNDGFITEATRWVDVNL